VIDADKVVELDQPSPKGVNDIVGATYTADDESGDALKSRSGWRKSASGWAVSFATAISDRLDADRSARHVPLDRGLAGPAAIGRYGRATSSSAWGAGRRRYASLRRAG